MVDYSNIPRDSRRVPLETRVQFKFDRFSGFLSEYSANISPGGFFLRTRAPQAHGTVLDFEFRLGGWQDRQGDQPSADTSSSFTHVRNLCALRAGVREGARRHMPSHGRLSNVSIVMPRPGCSGPRSVQGRRWS